MLFNIASLRVRCGSGFTVQLPDAATAWAIKRRMATEGEALVQRILNQFDDGLEVFTDALNDFQSTVTASGVNVSLADANSLSLGAVSAEEFARLVDPALMLGPGASDAGAAGGAGGAPDGGAAAGSC